MRHPDINRTTTPRRGWFRPRRRPRTLVDMLRNDISRTDSRESPERDLPPGWLRAVEDAILRQDMLWVLDSDIQSPWPPTCRYSGGRGNDHR